MLVLRFVFIDVRDEFVKVNVDVIFHDIAKTDAGEFVFLGDDGGVDVCFFGFLRCYLNNFRVFAVGRSLSFVGIFKLGELGFVVETH